MFLKIIPSIQYSDLQRIFQASAYHSSTSFWLDHAVSFRGEFVPFKIQAILWNCDSESHSVMSNSSVTPMACSLPGSSVHGILQQESWGGLSFPFSGDLPNPGIKPRSPVLQADFLCLSHQGNPNFIVDHLKITVVNLNKRCILKKTQTVVSLINNPCYQEKHC